MTNLLKALDRNDPFILEQRAQPIIRMLRTVLAIVRPTPSGSLPLVRKESVELWTPTHCSVLNWISEHPLLALGALA